MIFFSSGIWGDVASIEICFAPTRRSKKTRRRPAWKVDAVHSSVQGWMQMQGETFWGFGGGDAGKGASGGAKVKQVGINMRDEEMRR